MNAYVGMPVTYVPRPERRETEMAALVTAVHPDDRCDLIIFPPMAESIQQPKVPMLSDRFTNHVWKAPATQADAQGGGSPAETDVLLASLIGRIAALEAKRGPGRPPNLVKASERENA